MNIVIRKNMKKVMCFGTFDKLHEGHISYFKQSKKYGNYLIVVIARDINVEIIKRRKSFEDESKRFKNVKKAIEVDYVVFGGAINNKYDIIRKLKPDVLCLGYDQGANLEELKRQFNGEILRMKPYKEETYKSSLM